MDLRERGVRLRQVDPRGAVFLGCFFAPDDEEALRSRGGLVFPRLPDQPSTPIAASSTTRMRSTARATTRPALTRLSTPGPGPRYRDPIGTRLAVTLHDHAISDALDDATAAVPPTQLVGVVGRHAVQRGGPYAAAADLGAALNRAGRLVLTGGGPGAMETANLGAYLSPWPGSLDAALPVLSARPTYHDGIDAWFQAALAVRRRWPAAQAGIKVSVPTWFYGHEPTGVFATQIAKYFTNAPREDTLLNRCRGGIIYLPGQAGTVQEIFQALTENFWPPTRRRWPRWCWSGSTTG